LLFRPIHKALGGKLRFLFCGGAALNRQTVRDFSGLGLPLLQGWGMTEASPALAVQRFSRSRFLFTNYYETHAGSVGEAIPGVELRLIDVPEKAISVEAGGEGEVVARGENVFMGYWQAEEETEAVKQDGWLHTGDLARIEKDGSVYLTGRSKYIIVLDSGEKVHPDEVETKLSESPLIQDVCVLGRPGRDKVQVAALIYPNVEAVRNKADEGSYAMTEDAVRRLVTGEVERLGRELAAYKRVSRIELTDTPMPKTPLQKVARGRIDDEYSFDLESWFRSALPPD
jgi:long-chain acyl-CoA synthetase